MQMGILQLKHLVSLDLVCRVKPHRAPSTSAKIFSQIQDNQIYFPYNLDPSIQKSRILLSESISGRPCALPKSHQYHFHMASLLPTSLSLSSSSSPPFPSINQCSTPQRNTTPPLVHQVLRRSPSLLQETPSKIFHPPA